MGGTSKTNKGKKAKARKPAPAKAKGGQQRELREDELEKVAGGAAYVKIEVGEVRSDKHKGEIEIESYSWGVGSSLQKELTLRKK